ncbi:MAG TPA: hypothetical protein VMZ25_08845 [Terriglobales bacterium]|nr:hypothetical protein [Terriglobales bacterium]
MQSYTSPAASDRGITRSIPMLAILLLAAAVHGPLLLMQLPTQSYDANTHMFFAQHYAQSWFDPWNEKWFAGFSQTTYPPLTHQWIALFSRVIGLKFAYLFVQLCVLLLLPVGVYRYAKLWVEERAASYAALGTIFLGSLALLVYQAGQLPTTTAAALTLNALPFFYSWSRSGSFSALIKGVFLVLTAAAAHHVTVLFGIILFALPVLALAILDRRETTSSTGGVVSRAAMFAVAAVVGIGLVLLPYWMALLQNPIRQLPIPHDSRVNYLLNTMVGLNYWVIPMGALILVLPYIFIKGLGERRLRPLFFGWYLTMLLGLGGTTPVGRVLLGRAYEVLTFERFTFWATLMALPFAGLMASRLVHRYRTKALIGLWVAAVFTFAAAVSWTTYRPITTAPFEADAVIDFLNRDDHNKFRYLLLGFGVKFSDVGIRANANSVDGDYNAARLLPELTEYGAARLDNAKYYGTAGMESLRAMLKHANQYGLKYIFVRDRYYEPLIAFAGWRQVETYDSGNVALWSKEDVPYARPVERHGAPTAFQGYIWGTFPILASMLTMLLLLLWPERRPLASTISFPTVAATNRADEVLLREAK